MDFEQRFFHHLGAARQQRSIRFKQIFYNARMFYVLPIVLSMTIANFVAHAFFNGKNQPIEWMATAFGVTFLLFPFAYRFLRKDMTFNRECYYMLEAIKQTLEDSQQEELPKKQ